MPKVNALAIEPIPLLQKALADVLKRAGIAQVQFRSHLPAEQVSEPSEVNLVVAALAAVDSCGASAIDLLRNGFPGAAIVITSEVRERRRVFELLASGVDGFVPTTLAIEEMADAYRQVLAGRTYVPVLDRDLAVEPKATLTRRQAEVVSLMRRGLSNKEIARQLSISPGTVKVHLNSVYRAVGVHNRIAALVALQRSDVYVEPAASTEARQSSSRTQLEAA